MQSLYFRYAEALLLFKYHGTGKDRIPSNNSYLNIFKYIP